MDDRNDKEIHCCKMTGYKPVVYKVNSKKKRVLKEVRDWILAGLIGLTGIAAYHAIKPKEEPVESKAGIKFGQDAEVLVKEGNLHNYMLRHFTGREQMNEYELAHTYFDIDKDNNKVIDKEEARAYCDEARKLVSELPR